MKGLKGLWLGLIMLPLAATLSRAEIDAPGNLGLGIALGQPIGATAKYWLNKRMAIDAMVGYHFSDNVDLHADYLWHSSPIIPVTGGRVPFYMGVGGRVLAGDDSDFGIRFPLGITFLSDRADALEFFAELAPVMELIDDIDFDMDGMVGVRFYFNP